MRRLFTMIVLVAALPALAACGSTRDDARSEFTDQLEQEGGLPRPVAECVADRFFAARSTEELAAFFERVELTEAEEAEFARLGQECVATYASTSTAG